MIDSLAARLRLLVLAALLILAGLPLQAKDAEWTVMVYMNGKNNLEPAALMNYHDMAEVGSTDAVNIVVEMGRPVKVRYTHDDGDWTGVKRFLVKKGVDPLPQNALMDLGPSDMGSVQTVTQFISWAKQKYPARHYMLVIWNHGQGWRYQLAKTVETRQAASRKGARGVRGTALDEPNVRTVGGYRSVSSDDDSGNILFNLDVQRALSDFFPNTRKLDLLGFDACLMSMIETAYAFSNNVQTLVASEELEPGDGWHYAPWLAALTADPSLDGERLAAAVVQSYKARYGDRGVETLSVMRMANVVSVSQKLSQFAVAVMQAGPSEMDALLAARKRLRPYGEDAGLNTSIDLVTVLDQYEKSSHNAALTTQSKALRQAISSQVASNYASTHSANPANQFLPRGSRGLAIYFPASKKDFMDDWEHEGYLKTNTRKPVAFVQNERWADLLYKMLGI